MKKNKIFALGFFDGVHLGHQALLYACQRMAERSGVGTAAITFEQHPQALFSQNPPLLINATADRCDLLQQYAIETILTYPVNEAVMGMPWQDFLMELCRYHGAKGFVCGYDFRFGHKGAGDAQKLQQFCQQQGLPCLVLPEQTMGGKRISSTYIRTLIEAGDMQTAAKFLGHPHMLCGNVVSGRQLGRTIGVPTANILIPDEIVVPKLGVYATECLVDGIRHKAVTNIGSRPTVKGHQVRAESWILDFDGDLYGKHMTVLFHKFLRPEQKFDSLEELKVQISKDAVEACRLLQNTY